MNRRLIALFAALGCAHTTLPDAPPPPGFDDHTVPSLESVEAFRSFCDLGRLPVQCKFVLTRFWEAGGKAALLESRFYDMHDEWYWFRLLNGQPVDGVDEDPLHEARYETVTAIEEAYRGRTDLPLDLDWREKRLASPEFYTRTLGRCIGITGWTRCTRAMGAGSVLYLPPDPRRKESEAQWLFELDFADEPTEAELTRYVERLEPILPTEARGRLRWLARTSDLQESLAATIRGRPGPLRDRIATYSDLVVPGTVASYTRGIVAGRLRFVPRGGLSKVALAPTDIVLMEDVPDDLPPVAAIVTAAPQTPQAHLNLLCAARGTPNVYSSDAFKDPLLASWAHDETPAVLEVGDGTLRWKPLTAAEWTEWLGFTGRTSMHVTAIDPSSAPYVVDLSFGGLAAMRRSLPLVGGKSAGLMALLGFPELPTPYRPLSITIRAYAEHLGPLRAALEGLLEDPDFQDDRRVRFLALDGREAMVAESHGDPAMAAWLEGYVPSSAVADVVTQGGVRRMIEHSPLAPAFGKLLRQALERQFGTLSPSQGLRFRSSSTAEDVDGFNGAGVYDSNTGYLDPEHKKTVEHALKKTWASYWSFGAFEERRLAGIPHLDGNMAVLVEPSFQDELETANGVVLAGIGPDRVELTVNAQHGALSVTNPEPGSTKRPEVVRVLQVRGSAPIIVRDQPATDGPVLSDAELTEMLARVGRLAAAWLEDANRGLPASERSRSLVLDLEFRRVAAGWPALRSGEPLPPRLVYKQVRPLSRPPRVRTEDLDGAEVPRDVLAATTSVLRRTCSAGPLRYEAMELATDPAATLVQPLDAWVRIDLDAPVESLGLSAGDRPRAKHTDVTTTHSGPGRWSVTVRASPDVAARWGFDRVTIADGGAWSLGRGAEHVEGTGATCSAVVAVLTPSAWLAAKLHGM